MPSDPENMIRLLPCKFSSYVSPPYISSSAQIRQSPLSIPLSLPPKRESREHHGQVHNFIHVCPHRRPHSSSLRLLSRLHRRHNRAPFLPRALLSLRPLPRGTSINTSANHHFLACRRIIRRSARDALLLEIWSEGVFVAGGLYVLGAGMQLLDFGGIGGFEVGRVLNGLGVGVGTLGGPM